MLSIEDIENMIPPEHQNKIEWVEELWGAYEVGVFEDYVNWTYGGETIWVLGLHHLAEMTEEEVRNDLVGWLDGLELNDKEIN